MGSHSAVFAAALLSLAATAASNGNVIVNYTADAGGTRTKAWRKVCKAYGKMAAAYQVAPPKGPLGLMLLLYKVRPKCHYHTSKARAGQLREDAPQYPTMKPDLTKLRRSTEDALTGYLWQDDCQVVTAYEGKRYGVEPGARVLFWECK